jgi:regulator of nucleoside diphosphate kinase
MSTDFDSRLTARAASVLTAMLDHAPGTQPSFAALLRRKLSHSSICFGSDIPPGVVTLNSQVLYTVDGELAGPHLIVSSEGHDFPDYALSIHDIRGLALLGLSEGQSIHIAEDDAAPTMLSVVKVGFAPPAGSRVSPDPARVVPFRGKPAAPPTDFKPDDPGPRAA